MSDLTAKDLVEIRDEMRGMRSEMGELREALRDELRGTNARLDQTNQRLGVLAEITQGIDTRLTRMETQNAFIPRRVEVLEQKVARLESLAGTEE